jgi:tetratricopeptide (TPR) repeat protein
VKIGRILLTLAAAALLARAVAPELSRYAAERRVGLTTSAFRSLVERAREPESAADLLRVGEAARQAAAALPGDPRPLMVAGAVSLVTRQPDRALETYRDAFATGERAEIDLNLGRAYALAGRREESDAAFLRAGWISPEILSSLTPEVADPIRARVGALARDLAEGRLAAPPPLPPAERR